MKELHGANNPTGTLSGSWHVDDSHLPVLSRSETSRQELTRKVIANLSHDSHDSARIRVQEVTHEYCRSDCDNFQFSGDSDSL